MKRFFLLCVVAICGVLALSAISNAFMATAQTQPGGHTYQITLTVHQVARINQLDPAQYNSFQDYQAWAYSTCSTAAMAEVANSYGHHYRIADILKVQARIKEITPALGLVEDAGIARTMTHFGFQTSWSYRLSLDQILQLADTGTPVIVSWPPARYPQGHLVVVESGTATTISIADSSRYDRHTLSRAQFLAWWGGFSAVVTPTPEGQS